MKDTVLKHWFGVLLSIGLVSLVLFVIVMTTDESIVVASVLLRVMYLLATLAAAVSCGIIAKAHRRIWVAWAIGSLLFPYVLPFVLLLSVRVQGRAKIEGPAPESKWIPIEEWRSISLRFETRHKVGFLLFWSAVIIVGWGLGQAQGDEWAQGVTCAVYALIGSALSFWALGREGLQHMAVRGAAQKRKDGVFVSPQLSRAWIALLLVPVVLALIVLAMWLSFGR